MKANVKKAMFALRDDLKTSIQTNSTVVVNRNDLDLVVNQLFFSGGEWSNQSALGYAIASMEMAGFSADEIGVLVMEMNRQFDERTLDSAADVYRKSSY